MGFKRMRDNIAGDKLFGYLDRIVGDRRPITADIFLTNYCNNRCPYCTYGRWELDKEARAMKFEDFKRYAERLTELGVQGVILTGGGEPTLNPDFYAITQWMEKKGIHYGINTNFNKLVYIKPDYLKVSLDGYDEDSYERSRGVRRYAQVIENIKEYADWKEKNSPKTTLGIQWVATSVEDVFRFYEANKVLPVDYIVYRPFESTGGSYYKGKKERETASVIMAAINEIAKNDERIKLNFKWTMLGVSQKDCTAQWSQIAVNEKGEVMYCCHKPYEIVGNVMDEDILEKKERFKTDISKCDIPCRLTAPNSFVAKVMKERSDPYFI